MGGLTYRKSPGPDHTFGDNAGAPLRYCVKFLAQILGLSGGPAFGPAEPGKADDTVSKRLFCTYAAVEGRIGGII